jgi:Zn-dependent protease with chaperone function/uncharacterized tellurite resistance protein B-like protein
MNFFQDQDRARRNTGRLMLLMTLAVICLVTLTSLVVSVAIGFMADSDAEHRTLHVAWGMFPIIAVIIFVFVVSGSLYKSLQLSDGGKVIAERLGGRLINLNQHSDDERRVLNVVEEMAIASGSPVPPVYVIEDTSINAFAAGLTAQNAVIGVTRGTLRLLSREELQGVIAHEFSHIHNGDMRLNTRLVALLHGMLIIGLMGEFGMRSAKDSDKAAVPVFFFGATLWMLGYAGTFLGSVIKAAVSREREYLADASAVQFTRNPESIGGALKKIGGYSSNLSASHAAEFSHLYFSAGVAAYVEGFLATHPPLKKRIRRVEPHWDGKFPEVVWPAASSQSPSPSSKQYTPVDLPLDFSLADIQQSIAAVGSPQPQHLALARDALSRLDGPLRAAAHNSVGAQALIYGLLLSSDARVRQQQRQLLTPQVEEAVCNCLDDLTTALGDLDQGLRLPLLDLAIPALKQLSKEAFRAFSGNMALLIRADGKVELLEWTLLRIIERNVGPPRPVKGGLELTALAEEVAVLLSTLARAGHDNSVQAHAAFVQGCKALPDGLITTGLRPSTDIKLLQASLNRLNRLWPLQKPQLLKAMARCIEHDGRVTAAEAELMRAVADILDCPLPPISGFTQCSVPSDIDLPSLRTIADTPLL